MDARAGRRRGAALEEAILGAAWAELIERGYADMTLEAVAKRAGTSRPVLARRWPSRTRLATAVLARYLAQNPVDVPDLGSVGAEMRLFSCWETSRPKSAWSGMKLQLTWPGSMKA